MRKYHRVLQVLILNVIVVTSFVVPGFVRATMDAAEKSRWKMTDMAAVERTQDADTTSAETTAILAGSSSWTEKQPRWNYSTTPEQSTLLPRCLRTACTY